MGDLRAEPSIAEARYRMCATCPVSIKVFGKPILCTNCKCNLSPPLGKPFWANQRCPLGFW